MKVIFVMLCSLLTTSLLAMNQDREISYYFSTLPKATATTEDEIIPIIIKNGTGIPIKIRGRFGPVNNEPLGYICDVNTPNTPQIVYLSHRQVMKFNIKKKYLPLRVRVWQVDFDPDSDMAEGKPTFASDRNVENSLITLVVNNEFANIQAQKKLIELYWDNDSQTFTHRLRTIRSANLKNCINGSTNNYCVNPNTEWTCKQ